MSRTNLHTQPRFIMLKAIALLMAIFSNVVNAIDNPDSLDLTAEFESRERPILEITERSNGYRASLVAYTDYLIFLDQELNAVYKNLQATLPVEKQQQLKQSQITWLKYRDMEFKFIENTWTKADFGSSSGIARGQFKASILRDRIIQLMDYLKAH